MEKYEIETASVEFISIFVRLFAVVAKNRTYIRYFFFGRNGSHEEMLPLLVWIDQTSKLFNSCVYIATKHSTWNEHASYVFFSLLAQCELCPFCHSAEMTEEKHSAEHEWIEWLNNRSCHLWQAYSSRRGIGAYIHRLSGFHHARCSEYAKN